MDNRTANDIFTVLVSECGARESMRDMFVHTLLTSKDNVEFRFQGDLGFGGKFYMNADRWYVNCYPEDENESRRFWIDIANDRLATMKRAEV